MIPLIAAANRPATIHPAASNSHRPAPKPPAQSRPPKPLSAQIEDRHHQINPPGGEIVAGSVADEAAYEGSIRPQGRKVWKACAKHP